MAIELPMRSSAAIILYVEDSLTRDYLKAIWEDPTWIAFYLGGGNDGVRALVRSLEEEGYTNIFGLIDRDFQDTNKSKWMDRSKNFRTFILPAHEIENYLLDATALQASRYQNRDRDTAAIDARMVSKARQLCWWAACRDVIAELKRRFREPFVGDPKQRASDKPFDRAAAVAHICGSEWFGKLAGEASRSGQADIEALLDTSFANAEVGIRSEDETWRQDFAGKEILRDVAGWMCHRPEISRFPSSDSEFFSDLAKEIAVWQLANNAVPPDLTDLLTALEARIARPTPATPASPPSS